MGAIVFTTSKHWIITLINSGSDPFKTRIHMCVHVQEEREIMCIYLQGELWHFIISFFLKACAKFSRFCKNKLYQLQQSFSTRVPLEVGKGFSELWQMDLPPTLTTIAKWQFSTDHRFYMHHQCQWTLVMSLGLFQ